MNLAQFNIAKMKGLIDSSIMDGFRNSLDYVNAIAEKSPGFIWRLKDESGDATNIKVFNDEYLIVNMSVWKDIDSLFNYVYHSDHVEYFKRRKEWFHKMEKMHMVLWPVPEDHFPSPEEGKERLEHLIKHGESDYAFSFKQKHKPKSD